MITDKEIHAEYDLVDPENMNFIVATPIDQKWVQAGIDSISSYQENEFYDRLIENVFSELYHTWKEGKFNAAQ